MKLSLAELLMIKAKIEKKRDEYKGSMSRGILNQHESIVLNKKEGTKISPEDGKTYEIVFGEFVEYSELVILVTAALAKANALSTFKWDDKDISCTEAILLLKQYQMELACLKQASYIQTQTVVVDPRQGRGMVQGQTDYSYEQITKANFDRDWLDTRTQHLTRKITKLEVELQKANYENSVEISHPRLEEFA